MYILKELPREKNLLILIRLLKNRLKYFQYKRAPLNTNTILIL